MLNKVILMGRLTRNPELKTTPSGVSVVTFSLAVERNFAKQGEERKADFINCVAWRNQADFLAKYFEKGQMLALSGNIQTREYDDKNGNRVYVTEVVADEIHFAGDKKADAKPQAKETKTETTTDADEFVLLPADDDLPF